MTQIQDILTNNAEIIESKNVDSIGGHQVTYEPQEDGFAKVQMQSEYIDARQLNELSEFVTEFQSIIDQHPEDISFVVGNIVLSADKPIKIRRIIS